MLKYSLCVLESIDIGELARFIQITTAETQAHAQ